MKKEMEFERAFVKAGGLLLAGCDPTSFGGVLPDTAISVVSSYWWRPASPCGSH